MQGVDVFCERCGTLQPKPGANTPRSAGVLARRVLDAVGITESRPVPVEDYLRLCLGCRGYSCPACWNEAEGACQTCAPLPEPIIEVAAEPEPLLELPQPAPAAYAPQPVVEQPAPQPALLADFVELSAEPATVLAMESEAEPQTSVVVAAEPEPEPEPVIVAPEPEPQPLVAAEPEPEAEPVVAAEPEPQPEPVIVAPEPEPQPISRPAVPRMPVLPLPPPRPVNEPLPLPVPPLTDYPVAPQIAFSAQVNAAAKAAPVAGFEPHMLLAPPPSVSRGEAAGLRTCATCQLSLSTRAHFCRRCGTAQPT
jgi:hypothetical protein